jgi:hypothetical protein
VRENRYFKSAVGNVRSYLPFVKQNMKRERERERERERVLVQVIRRGL